MEYYRILFISDSIGWCCTVGIGSRHEGAAIWRFHERAPFKDLQSHQFSGYEPFIRNQKKRLCQEKAPYSQLNIFLKRKYHISKFCSVQFDVLRWAFSQFRADDKSAGPRWPRPRQSASWRRRKPTGQSEPRRKGTRRPVEFNSFHGDVSLFHSPSPSWIHLDFFGATLRLVSSFTPRSLTAVLKAFGIHSGERL